MKRIKNGNVEPDFVGPQPLVLGIAVSVLGILVIWILIVWSKGLRETTGAGKIDL